MRPENAGSSQDLGNEAVEGRIPVSILSSNRLLRETIARILIHTREFAVTATEPPKFSLGLDLAGVTPDVWVSDSLQCFVDYAFPRRTDHDSTKPVGCVLVAMQDDAKHFLKAVRRGIMGYVLQDASADDVIAAVRGVARGEAVCPAFLTRVLFDYVASRASDVHTRAPRQFRLTRREQQLVPLVGRGLTNKEIAAELSLSEQTVKSHIHRILRKVGVEDRSAIVDACDGEQLFT
ncbi:MAG: response regulator transcription factor [Candidatus Acidiferrales bacterium]